MKDIERRGKNNALDNCVPFTHASIQKPRKDVPRLVYKFKHQIRVPTRLAHVCHELPEGTGGKNAGDSLKISTKTL